MSEEEKTITINRESDAAEGEEAPIQAEAPDAEAVDWQAEAEKFKESFIRGQADMDNMKKRLEREKSDFLKYATESLLKDLLPVLDNLDRALENVGCSENDAMMEGVRLTREGVVNVLNKYGVKPVKSLGEIFDPNFHEAVMQREEPTAASNTVLEEMQKGYILHDRLIRPSMVVVAK